MIRVVPYRSAGGLCFDSSCISDCEKLFGPALSRRIRDETVDLYYIDFIARFHRKSEVFVEMTVVPPGLVEVGGAVFDWSYAGFCRVVMLDGSPLIAFGFVILASLGVAISGVHDDDKGQRALTIFRKGALDSLLPQAQPFPSTTTKDTQ